MIGHAFYLALLALSVCFALPIYFDANGAEHRTSERHVGVLIAAAWPQEMIQSFQRELAQAGWSEGTNLVIDWKETHGDYDRLPQLASDLVEHKVDVIISDGTPATASAKRAAFAISIVMVHVAYPLGAGLASSLAHPGGNITGFSLMVSELAVKRLELLK